MGDPGHKPVSLDDVKHFYALRLSINHGRKAYIATSKSNKKDFMYVRVADFCNQHDVDPRTFIDWVFNVDAPLYPQPGMLMSDKYTRSFLSNDKPDVEFDKLKNRLESAMYRITKRRADEDLFEFILNPLNEIPAVLVCSLADKIDKKSELPAELVEKARSFVMLRPVYLARFPTLVPDWLR